MISSHAEISSAYSDLVEEHKQLKAKYYRLRDAVIVACDELEEEYDYADDTGPNWAMRIGTDLKEGLYGPGGF